MSAVHDETGKADAVAAMLQETLDKAEGWLVRDNPAFRGPHSWRAAMVAIIDHLFVIAKQRGGDVEMDGLMLAAITSMESLRVKGRGI